MTVAVWEAMRRRPVRFLFGAWPLRSWAFLLSGLVVGPVVLFVCAALLLVGVGLSVVGVGLLVLLTLAVVGIPVAALERRRLRLVEPEPLLDPHGSLPGTSALPWLRTRLRERATWRELAYTVLLGVVFTATGIGFAALLGLSLILTATPVIVWAIAPDTVMLVPGQPLSDPVAALPGSAAGLVGLVVSAYAGGLLAGVQVRTAQFLLAARDEDFSSRVIELTRSRARLVDAFEAERRRIERDLHDGAQQQLVALTMTLGLAELELRGQDSGAAPLVSRARDEARQALDQLRSLVRGIHPQVLTDHGLPAAVAELALRNPVPVTVDLDLPHRLPSAVETTAYFTVTEALTNASKHSGADQVSVVGRLRDDTLVLLVTDDGHGGADPEAGCRSARIGGPGGHSERQAHRDQSRRRSHAAPGGGAVLRVVLAEDAVLLRAGLVELLSRVGHEVTAAVGDAEELARAVAADRPDVVITDVRMPPGFRDEGLRAALELRRADPSLPVLVLSQYVATAYATQLLSGSPAAGGLGYLLKDRVGEVTDFLDALDRVASGQTVIDPEVVRVLLQQGTADKPLQRLTPREREVLAVMAEGLNNQAIAQRLTITEASVVKHASSIFMKLELDPAEGNRRVLAVLAHLRRQDPAA